MENEELNQVETEEESFIEVANFDELWDEGDDDLHDDHAEEAGDDEQTDGAETEAQEAEAEAEADGEPETDEETKPEEQKPEAENQRFKLKYNGEEIEVDRETVIELAQKGKDYDRIKAERDNFKTEAPVLQRYKEQEAFLKELADESKMSVEELMDNTKARMLMAKDDKLTQEDALKQVREAKKATEKKEPEKAEPTPEERRQAMFANFMQAYPNVKADEIPKEVWEDAGRTFDLTGAYLRYQNRQLQEEIKTLRQNNKNKERSTGSMKSVGSRTKDQAFDALWYDDDD